MKALSNYIDEKEAGIIQLESIIKRVLEDKARFERELRIQMKSFLQISESIQAQ